MALRKALALPIDPRPPQQNYRVHGHNLPITSYAWIHGLNFRQQRPKYR